MIQDRDLFGNIVERDILLRERFMEPPFSVLDSKGGKWQARKRQWKSLGIESHLGRDTKAVATFDDDVDPVTGLNKYGRKPMEGVSIFDPTLAELMYAWFCPPGGRILDPFAGGSVRGIVAAYLGYQYTGIDIRDAQVMANELQAEKILEDVTTKPVWVTGDSAKVLDQPLDMDPPDKVKISGAQLQQMFQPCEPNYIKSVCHGACCQGSGGLMVTVHESEREAIGRLGGEVDESGMLRDKLCNGVCMFKSDDGLCGIHGDNQPFGCKASPFTLNSNNTLIVRNRYRMLRCYNTPQAVPAYKAHRWSLDQIFGAHVVEGIIMDIIVGKDPIWAPIKPDIFKILKDNDEAKRARVSGQFDMILSCPPYSDLEVYSDLRGDISFMEYDNFMKAYTNIIIKACRRLKVGGYAAWVVGDIRGKKGSYRGFVADTIKAFESAGMGLYNDCVYLQPLGTAMLRAAKIFEAGKKLTKVHENVLIFRKDG
jgi:hypothetical protein